MDLVEIVELTGVDTFKCVDFREAFVEHSESPVRTRTQRPRLAPQRHPTHFSQEDRALSRKTFIYQGEEMKQRTNHLATALSASFCPSLSPSSFSSPSSLFYPSSLFLSASSPGFIFCSLIFLFPYSHSLLCVAVLKLRTVSSVCATVRAPEMGGVGELCVCIWPMALSCQGSSYRRNAGSFPDPSSRCGTGSQT